VGGRFSVLTPVGLFPIAVAGIDIRNLLAGASEAMDFCSGDSYQDNMAGHYAAVRNILFRKGFTTEVMAAFQPQLHFIASGGNNWPVKVKGKTAQESSRLLSITLPTSTPWAVDAGRDKKRIRDIYGIEENQSFNICSKVR
jgi:hypothetical protein